MKYTVLALTLFSLSACAENKPVSASLEVIEIPGKLLAGNPMGDPIVRKVALFSPAGVDSPLPLVLYLPGWGGSSEDSIARGTRDWLAEIVARLAAGGNPVRIAAVDARSRYGGSQYLDSPAIGNYAQWLIGEVMPAIEAQHPLPPGAKWIVAGHSSGGYGALRLGMGRSEKISAVVALSPDSDLDVTHIGFAKDPGVRAITRADLDAAMAPAPNYRMPRNGTAQMMLGLSANYAPGTKPGTFEWIYDDEGRWRPDVWQRWIEQDPLTLVRKKADAFSKTQRIYLDGAEHDEFGANIGARKIHDILKSRPSPVTFLETPGHHSDHLVERLSRGILWISGKKPPAIEEK